MTTEIVMKKLSDAGHEISGKSALSNGTGVQLVLSNGIKVNIFNTGKVQVCKAKAALAGEEEEIRGLLEGSKVTPANQSKIVRNVFVVYGHDDPAKRDLENMLRRWDLNPIILDQLPSEGQTIIEKLEKFRGQASYAIVLATPDDEGHKAGKTDEKTFRARQNVVLELGMMLAHLGRSKVAILIKDPDKMERPSDIQGLMYIPFKDNVDDAKVVLAKELDAQGIHVDVKKL